MSQENEKLELTVLSSETRDDKPKKTTVYEIQVKTTTTCHSVSHKYSSVVSFLEKVKKNYPQLHNYKLPQRKFFSVKSDLDLIKERKEVLNVFLDKLSKIDGIISNSEFMSFFNIKNSKEANTAPTATGKNTNSVGEGTSTEADDYILGESQNSKAQPTDFNFIKVIGKGSFGRVYLAKHIAEDKFYAVKVLDKEVILKRNETRHIMAERGVLLQNIKNPFLVALHYSFQTSDKLYFVLDYVNGGELFFHLQREKYFPETRARFYACEIGVAIGYLHSLNIIYRDLKPENILLDKDGHIVLTDFGLAKQCLDQQQTTSTFCGTPEYLAPELLSKKPYDKTVDWWCFGCVVFEMMSGLPPFYERDTSEMYNNILFKPLRFKPYISVVSKSFLEALLQKDPKTRLGYGPNDFEDIKQHAFLRRINWTEVIEKKIPVPFDPKVSGEMDLKNIDKEFVSEEVTASVQRENYNPMLDNENNENPFTGFTYVQNNDLLDDD